MARPRKYRKKALPKGQMSPRERRQARFVTVPCPTCGGSGRRGTARCGLCKGTGKIQVLP